MSLNCLIQTKQLSKYRTATGVLSLSRIWPRVGCRLGLHPTLWWHYTVALPLFLLGEGLLLSCNTLGQLFREQVADCNPHFGFVLKANCWPNTKGLLSQVVARKLTLKKRLPVLIGICRAGIISETASWIEIANKRHQMRRIHVVPCSCLRGTGSVT